VTTKTREQRERELLDFLPLKSGNLKAEYRRVMKLQEVPAGTPAARMIMAILESEYPPIPNNDRNQN
jgi:hypothetical protein